LIALLQRVTRASVTVEQELVGRIGPGLLVLLCAEHGDSEREADRMLSKILKLRIFGDDAGKMNRSVQDIAGGLLVVSQFTLAADTASGNRPGFTGAAEPAVGLRLYEYFLAQARLLHPVVQNGRFGTEMAVELVNDGPVTIPLRMQPPA
jgi:D-tyrosyl-tRNA(Tyr) deacylase